MTLDIEIISVINVSLIGTNRVDDVRKMIERVALHRLQNEDTSL